MQAERQKQARASYRLWVLMAVLMLALAGCGNGGTDATGTTGGTGNTPATGTTNATGNTVEDTDAANANEGEKAANTEETTRTVTDAYGTVEVPAQPARVVVLDIGALDNLLEMGVKPVGAPSILAAGDPYPGYLQGADGIDNIGTVNEPNLETIDALKPDLIIGNKDAHDAIYEQLKKIAPTVFVETLGVTWKENLQLHADAINRQDEGKALLEAYEQRVSGLKSTVAGQSGKEVSLIRPRADKIQVYLKETFAGTIMEDAGIARPAAQQDAGFSKDVTEEQIADLDGDIIFWFNREPDAFAKLESSPLWATLKGAQNQAVYPVDWEYWLSGLGIQAVNKVLDDLEQYVAK